MEQLSIPTLSRRHKLYYHATRDVIINAITAVGGTWAWVCKDSRHFTVPISYTHPLGAVKWVDITHTRIQLHDTAEQLRFDGY